MNGEQHENRLLENCLKSRTDLHQTIIGGLEKLNHNFEEYKLIKRSGRNMLITLLIGMGVGFCVDNIILTNHYLHKGKLLINPTANNVFSSGCVGSSLLEIHIKDLNDDGKSETIATYKGKQFLLKDENGVPVAYIWDKTGSNESK